MQVGRGTQKSGRGVMDGRNADRENSLTGTKTDSKLSHYVWFPEATREWKFCRSSGRRLIFVPPCLPRAALQLSSCLGPAVVLLGGQGTAVHAHQSQLAPDGTRDILEACIISHLLLEPRQLQYHSTDLPACEHEPVPRICLYCYISRIELCLSSRRARAYDERAVPPESTSTAPRSTSLLRPANIVTRPQNMSQFGYGAQPQGNPAYAPQSAQNLQFYPSQYAPADVSGHATPSQASYGGYGVSSGAANYGFGAPAAGVSGRMGESGGLRTGWIAAFSTEGYEGEPPLLEELGVNFSHIQAKVRSWVSIW